MKQDVNLRVEIGHNEPTVVLTVEGKHGTRYLRLEVDAERLRQALWAPLGLDNVPAKLVSR